MNEFLRKGLFDKNQLRQGSPGINLTSQCRIKMFVAKTLSVLLLGVLLLTPSLVQVIYSST